MLGWAEVCMHFFDFFHVVFVACCCNPCEAFKMFIGEAVSLFPLYSVHGWECWLASVCAHKEGHHFLHKWLQSGKIFFRHQTPEVTNTCSEFNFENVFCLQFYHFTFYSSTLCRAEQSDSWSERWHIYVEGVFNEVENLLVLIHILESGFKFPPQLFQNIHKFSVAEVLQQRLVICGDSSDLGKWMNSLSGMYRAVILFWNALIAFSMLFGSLSLPWSFMLRVFRWQVMSVRKASCVIQHGSSSSGSRFPLLSRKVQISGRRLRNRSSTFPRDNHLTSLCISKSLYSVS